VLGGEKQAKEELNLRVTAEKDFKQKSALAPES